MSHKASASARPRSIVALFLTALTILIVFPATAAASRSFESAVAYDAGAPCPDAIAVADVNADGKPDVLTAGGCPDMGSVSVFLGNGDGTFQAAMVYDSGGIDTTSLQVADVNGDGKPDVLAASPCSTVACPIPVVAVLLGNGDGTFQPPVTYDSGLQATSLAIADLNRDGKLDLVVAGSYLPGREAALIGVLLGSGDGTFHPVVTYGYGGPSMSAVLSDVNDDGRIDALVTIPCSDAYCKDGLLGVLLGNGDGTFQPALTYDAGYQPVSLAVADVNGDGRADALVTEESRSSLHYAVGVLLGDGDGTFGPVMSYDSGAPDAMSLAVGDVNLDGQPDVVVAHCDPGSKYRSGCSPKRSGIVSVLLGNADGTFRPPVLYKSGAAEARSVAVSDVNGDGRSDLLVVNTLGGPNGDGTLSVLLNILKVKIKIVLTGSPNPAQVNESVTLAATITSDPPVPDGELINFSRGAVKLGTGTTTNGTATLITSFSKAKTYGIKASFAGDPCHKSSSAWVKEVVNP